MADEGPTTTGSIKGKVDLDIAEALAKLEELKASIAGLRNGRDPKIQVDTGNSKRDLHDVDNELGNVERTATKTASSMGKVTGEAKKQNDIMAQLVYGLVAVSSAAPPVAAAAVGIGGAFGLMGAAGVLGIAGIVRGMKEGNAVGQQYAGVIKTLTGNVHSLQDSAAKGLFPGIQAATAVLNQSMPQLNGYVSHFSGMLGAILPTGLDAVLNLLKGAEPLFDQAGKYIQNLVRDLDGFSTSDAYSSFIQYSIQNLPQVEKLIGDVVKLAGDFLAAWAPVGSATLPMLDDLVKGIDGIIKATGSLIPLAVTAFAFGKFIMPAIGALSTLKAALFGVRDAEVAVAVAGAGVGAAGAAGAGAGVASAAAARAAVGLGAPMALDGTALGIGAAAGGTYATPLGWIAGAGLGTVAAANALGPKASSVKQYSQGTVQGDINRLTDPAASRGRGGVNGGGGTALTNYAQNGGAGGFANGIQGMLGGQNVKDINNLDMAMASMVKSGNGDKAKAIIAGLGISAKTASVDFPTYTKSVKDNAGAIAAAAKITNDAKTGTAQLTGEVNIATSAAYLNVTSQNAAEESILATGAALKANKGAWSAHTAAGLADRDAVAQSVAAINAHATAINSDGKHTAEAKLYSDQHVLSLRKEGEAAGVSGDKMNAYIAKLLGVPKSVISKITANSVEAEQHAANTKKALEEVAHGNYKAALKADVSDAQHKTIQAKAFAHEYAAGNYKGILRGDFTPAQKAAAGATSSARGFAGGHYQARLLADASQALATANQTVASINAMRASIEVSVNAVGGNGAQVARNALLGNKGGSAGSPYFGMAAGGTPGMAWGGSPGGSIVGPGTASSDTAGLYRLANGEEVISNMFGQAEKWRPLLKAINSNKVDYRTFEKMAAHSVKSGTQSLTTIAPEIHIHNPVAVDPIQQTAEAAQLALAYAGLG